MIVYALKVTLTLTLTLETLTRFASSQAPVVTHPATLPKRARMSRRILLAS